jgi:transcription-repair coupling factor (superfamily II helicase)
LDEAILELKENEFKSVFSEELKEREFVKECILETDLSLVIPDDYVNDINERLTLYKRLDTLTFQDAVSTFSQELKDRFGQIPSQTKELINTLKLREQAKKIGFEKLVIKQNKLVGKFTTSHPAYFESTNFTKVLNFVQKHKKGVQLKEKNKVLILTIENIGTIQKANEKLQQLMI